MPDFADEDDAFAQALQASMADVQAKPTEITAETGSASSALGSASSALGYASSALDRASSALANPVLETVCHDCKTPVDPLQKGVLLLNKSQFTFRCPGCKSKCAALSTLFVQWPIDDFKRFSEEQKTNFWKSTGTTS